MTATEEDGATSGPGLLASLGYDGLGRLTGRTTAGGAGLSTSWAYGDNGLLSSLTQTLAWGAGTTLGFTYSAARQILTRSDSNGAYTAQPPAQSSTYAANGLNQVVSATGTRGGPATAAGLAYDPLGRIASVTQGGSTTSFLYAGWSLVGEYSSSGAILARYVPGAGMDAPVTMYTGPGTANRAWYAADQQGSILALADASGNATLQLAYGPYGEPLTPAGASAWGESRYGYTGQIGVAGALAWFDKARMYDPAQGRFLQTDPLGLSAGTNLYAYAVQDPVNQTDPTGRDIPTGSHVACSDGTGCGVDDVNSTPGAAALYNGNGGDEGGVRIANDTSGATTVAAVTVFGDPYTIVLPGTLDLPPSASINTGNGSFEVASTGPVTAPTSKSPECTAARTALAGLGRQLSANGQNLTYAGIAIVVGSATGAVFAPEALPAEAGGAESGAGLIEVGGATSTLGAGLEGYGRGGVKGALTAAAISLAVDQLSSRLTGGLFPGIDSATKSATSALLGQIPEAFQNEQVACGGG